MYGNIILNQEFSHITDEMIEKYAQDRDKSLLDSLLRYMYISKSKEELNLIIQFPMMDSDIKLDLTQEQSEKLQTKLGLREITIPF